jgi:hypothetical protein
MDKQPKLQTRAQLEAEYEARRQRNIEARREYYDEKRLCDADKSRGTKTLYSLADLLNQAHEDLRQVAILLGVDNATLAHLEPLESR